MYIKHKPWTLGDAYNRWHDSAQPYYAYPQYPLVNPQNLNNKNLDADLNQNHNSNVNNVVINLDKKNLG